MTQIEMAIDHLETWLEYREDMATGPTEKVCERLRGIIMDLECIQHEERVLACLKQP